ncbi:hypothetical protein ACSBRB_00380 [Staphylococcus auricularis]|uniref:hypothetical protein n=1 Tax=Staphylococcus auricularis TaxID=29379 RepID=UPI003EB91291
MSLDTFKQQVRKQLWFLNKKEKAQLESVFSNLEQSSTEIDMKKPIRFANSFLKTYVFKEKQPSTGQFFLLLFCMIFVYVILLGLFLFGLLTSLAAVQSFVNPEVQRSMLVVILTLIGAILLIVLSIFFIKQLTGYFTKKLLEYKMNRLRHE